MFRDFDRKGRVPPFALGALLAGRWRLDKIIGCGRTSVVYRAEDVGGAAPDARPVAIKALCRSLCADAAEVDGLLAEGRKMLSFAHPHIAQVYAIGVEAEVPFLALEAFAGGSLYDIAAAGRSISPASVSDLLRGPAEAAAFLHARGWVHADIKPGNLLRRHDGGVTLVDFGSARPIARGEGGGGDRIVTPAYTAPEVLRGEAPEPRDDVFALGVVAYELIAGRHPFDYRPALPDDIVCRPPGLDRRGWVALRAALSPCRADRPEDPRALATALAVRRFIPPLMRRQIRCPA